MRCSTKLYCKRTENMMTTFSSRSSSNLRFFTCNWAQILIPLVLAVLALVEDIFSREVIKLGTYFQMFKTIFRY